jgi:hypothetical protein
MALQDKAKRALIAARDVATGPLDGEWGENQTTHATAMLYLVADKLANDADKSVPRRFAQRFNMISEINNAIRGQGIHAKSGTSACNRTGEYDVALKGYIPLLYRYGNMLAPDVRYRILHLLNKTGPHDPDDEWISCVLPVPESENHIWMIESSRYLTNQLYAKRTADSHFNNARNGMDDYILKRLGNHMINDFIEYNARPYGRYSWAAIQNLADYADNQKVKDAAKGVLDYLSAKAAVSGNDGRRRPPYRRRVSNNKSNYFHEQGDRIKKRFMLYTAPTLVMKELTPPNWLEDFAASEVVLAAASNYQPPTAVIDLMVNTSHRSYYQDFSPPGEIYAAEPDFLIAGGGIVGTYAYTVAGIGKDEDLGVAQPTVLVPTGQFTTSEQMIRFRRPQNQDDFTGRCVAPGFACGYEPTIPPLYTRIPQCVARRGAWTFIDFSSDACKDAEHREFGFFAAVFRGSDGFGLLEVVPKARLNGSTLTAFADLVIASNGTPQLSTTQPNSYLTFGGNVIRFNPGVITPILSTGVAAIDDLLVRNDAGIARGTVVQSIGNTGKMTITNAFTGEKIGVGIDVPPAPPASMEAKAMVAALKKAGVDYSVPEPVVLEWLDNKNFTPYPAISDALLKLIEPGYLKRFVYLDVIVWNYVHTPGAASPRKMSHVDVAVLKQAILGGYNSRYGTAKNSFDSIFTPGARPGRERQVHPRGGSISQDVGSAGALLQRAERELLKRYPDADRALLERAEREFLKRSRGADRPRR